MGFEPCCVYGRLSLNNLGAVVACAYLDSDVGARLVSEFKFLAPLIATLASDDWYVYKPGALRPDNAQRGSALCLGRRC